jgi:hypothetical protein
VKEWQLHELTLAFGIVKHAVFLSVAFSQREVAVHPPDTLSGAHSSTNNYDRVFYFNDPLVVG